jgi:hypothetical protein
MLPIPLMKFAAEATITLVGVLIFQEARKNNAKDMMKYAAEQDVIFQEETQWGNYKTKTTIYPCKNGVPPVFVQNNGGFVQNPQMNGVRKPNIRGYVEPHGTYVPNFVMVNTEQGESSVTPNVTNQQVLGEIALKKQQESIINESVQAELNKEAYRKQLAKEIVDELLRERQQRVI